MNGVWRKLATSGLVALAALGCARKAPGPEACLRFALAWERIAVSDYDSLPPELDARVQTLTMRCLTQPFEAALVRCVIERGPRACRAEVLAATLEQR
ncbi:MAG TPA: hypothetical protein VHM70_17835 [Polyangiaceae bacterium]|jgi:hypothetical protein|nr:hypothetical protein [Polyangiaceae bacterium]